ncbi:MAG: 30S ribosomal protein S16 [Candidatus Omnitrophica bacterium]|nr:30S ribosomal protein S16 [Candidatus Omnitrophota bacterium]
MAVVIRLSRLGTKRKPHHKIVVTEQHTPREGRFIEQIGYYDPSKKPALVEIKEDRVLHWISVGAKPTQTVRSLFRSKKIPLKVKKRG